MILEKLLLEQGIEKMSISFSCPLRNSKRGSIAQSAYDATLELEELYSSNLDSSPSLDPDSNVAISETKSYQMESFQVKSEKSNKINEFGAGLSRFPCRLPSVHPLVRQVGPVARRLNVQFGWDFVSGFVLVSVICLASALLRFERLFAQQVLLMIMIFGRNSSCHVPSQGCPTRADVEGS